MTNKIGKNTKKLAFTELVKAKIVVFLIHNATESLSLRAQIVGAGVQTLS